MEGEQIVDWVCTVADRASKGLRALRRETRAGESGIERGVAAVQRAGRCVTDGLAEAKVLEEPPCRGFGRSGGSHPDGSEDVRIDVIDDDPLDQHDGKQKDDRRNVDASRGRQEVADWAQEGLRQGKKQVPDLAHKVV